ncbi:MAG: hypothetical protein RMA76_15305 [Deltaproteobacteria bacterium]|jgi:hypothetical protein
MTKREDDKKQRGWSLVFDENTDKSDTEERPAADNNMTVIDRDLSIEVNAALNALSRDQLLENVAIQDEVVGPGLDEAPEMTIRAPAPVFDSQPHVVAEPPHEEDTGSDDEDFPTTAPGGVDALDETPMPYDTPVPTLTDGDHEETVRPGSNPAEETVDERPASHERTMKAPIPYDLFHEGSLPEIEKAPPKITRRKVSAAERMPSPPRPPRRSGSETMLDLAAQLGMAPSASKPNTPADPSSEPRIVKETMEIPHSPNDEIDLMPFLDDEGKPGKSKDAKKPGPVVQQKSRPSEGANADDIHRLVAHTDAAARAIPVALAAFVIIGTITALAMLFTSGDKKQRHVEMRFFSLAGPAAAPMRPSNTPTRVNVDTLPEGVFVLFGQDILGKTPLAIDLPYTLDDRVAVELKSPYFERWVGEIQRDPTGEYRIFVELQRKQE